jgi:hypothetical protein
MRRKNVSYGKIAKKKKTAIFAGFRGDAVTKKAR